MQGDLFMGNDVNKLFKRTEIFINGLASTPLKKEHLFIAAFFEVHVDRDKEMTASVDSIKQKFKELILLKKEKYNKKSFKETLAKLSYTDYSYKLYPAENFYTEIILGDGFSPETIFELFTDQYDHIDESSANELVYNELFLPLFDIDSNYKTPDQREAYGNILYVRVKDAFYDILNTYKNKYCYDKCLKLCREYKNNKTAEDD